LGRIGRKEKCGGREIVSFRVFNARKVRSFFGAF